MGRKVVNDFSNVHRKSIFFRYDKQIENKEPPRICWMNDSCPLDADWVWNIIIVNYDYSQLIKFHLKHFQPKYHHGRKKQQLYINFDTMTRSIRRIGSKICKKFIFANPFAIPLISDETHKIIILKIPNHKWRKWWAMLSCQVVTASAPLKFTRRIIW